MDVIAFDFEKITNGFYDVYEQFNAETEDSQK